MRLRIIAAATAVGLVASIAPTVAAEAAKKPTFKVSISTSTVKADVGQTIKVSGKVTGPKAAKKRLLVQRKVGAGKWSTVKKVRTTKKRRYSTTVKVTTAGQQYLRVVAPKTKKARIGVSSARGFVGWRWLDAGANAATDGLVRSSITIDGKRHSPAWVPTETRTDGILFTETAGSCDTLTVGVGTEGDRESEVQMYFVQTASMDFVDFIGNGETYYTGGNGLVAHEFSIKPQAKFVALGVSGRPANAERAALVAPRLHCSTNALPKAVLPPF